MKSKLVIILLVIVLACSMAVFFWDKIAAFSVNRFTDYGVAYDKWVGNPFGKSEIEGLSLELKNEGILIKANQTLFNFRTGRLLRQGQLFLGCEMKGVSFAFTGKSQPDTNSADDILAIPFGPGQKYERITFTASLDKKTLKVSDFRADSKDVLMRGDYTLIRGKNEIAIDLKISFSPEMADLFAEDIKNNVLSLDEEGWYSTIINYKGNPVFLKALYSLAA
ncbi:MAG: hypothetical protein ABID83_00445 [Candidatus Omnitrophota bacterium]